MAQLQTYVGQFGEALTAWPEIWALHASRRV